MTDTLAISAPRLEQASLAEQAYLSVRERILKGELRLGAALSRRKLASELGMSLIPVAEALQRLEAEGLVESEPRVGTRVYMPTVEDIRERYVVREALESQVARLFSENATARDRKELGRMAEHMDALFNRRSSAQDDPEFLFAVQVYHFQLHMRIAEATGCQPLVKLVEQTSMLVFNWVWDLAAKRPALPPRFHRDLIEVLVCTDPTQADAAMRAHIRYGLKGIIQAITHAPIRLRISDKSRQPL